jgi:hypothetical protein
MVCAAAYSAGGMYRRAQYPVRQLAACTDSDQVRAVRFAHKTSTTNQNES